MPINEVADLFPYLENDMMLSFQNELQTLSEDMVMFKIEFEKPPETELAGLTFELEDRPYTLKDLGAIARKIKNQKAHEADLREI